MSPEQASGKAVDFRTDLWSLGAVLYEMLAGRPPFRGDTQLQVMHAIVHDDPPRLREVRPDLPAAIDAIVSRALEKDPAKRYQSGGGDGERSVRGSHGPGCARRQRTGLRAAYADSSGGADPAGGRRLRSGSISAPRNATGRASRRSRKSPG